MAGCFPDAPKKSADASDTLVATTDSEDAAGVDVSDTSSRDDADASVRCVRDDQCDRTDLCAPERCVEGACVVAPVECATSTVTCWTLACDPANGTCQPRPETGTPCDDDDPCTTASSCHAGTCEGDEDVVCEPLSACHDAGVCDDTSGVCSTPVRRKGFECPLGEATGHCSEGTCFRRQVALGGAPCVLFDNAVRCWGIGQLASGGRLWRFEREIAEIGTGVGSACARFVDGGVRCWSLGDSVDPAILGQGPITVDDPTDPAKLADIRLGGSATSLSVAGYVACASLVDGGLRCWGYDGAALGAGGISSIGDDEAPADVPLDVGDLHFVHVATGYGATCAVTDDGRLRCWGTGAHGALGNGHLDSFGDDPGETPATAGDTPVGFLVRRVAIGLGFVCALSQSGAVRCWGRGAEGQLGNRRVVDIGDDEAPSSTISVELGEPALAIAAGGFNACAVLASGVRCWGWGHTGINGQGDEENLGDDERVDSVPLVPLGDAPHSIAVNGAGAAACAIVAGGELNCWGLATLTGYGDGVDRGAVPGTMPPGPVPFE
ncbi:MAG: hypothetical protein H6745_33885 [Deltaproteobacteria bacterium]|nr:hypothetical protein [Deltaproteobacteria bacterium]